MDQLRTPRTITFFHSSRTYGRPLAVDSSRWTTSRSPSRNNIRGWILNLVNLPMWPLSSTYHLLFLSFKFSSFYFYIQVIYGIFGENQMFMSRTIVRLLPTAIKTVTFLQICKDLRMSPQSLKIPFYAYPTFCEYIAQLFAHHTDSDH